LFPRGPGVGLYVGHLNCAQLLMVTHWWVSSESYTREKELEVLVSFWFIDEV